MSRGYRSSGLTFMHQYCVGINLDERWEGAALQNGRLQQGGERGREREREAKLSRSH